jgi:two-component system cell cycle response regulator DivK
MRAPGHRVCWEQLNGARFRGEDVMEMTQPENSAAILIVDDNPLNLKLARVVLEMEGYRVRLAGDADEALRSIDEERPALILMDIQLPGMDGLELTRLLKSNPVTRGILIIAMTAFAMKGDDLKAVAAGCDGYVSKPFDIDTFPEFLQGFLSKRGSSLGRAEH